MDIDTFLHFQKPLTAFCFPFFIQKSFLGTETLLKVFSVDFKTFSALSFLKDVEQKIGLGEKLNERPELNVE